MTFKKAQTVIDSMPAGPERGEFAKLLSLVERAIEQADLKDEASMRQELQSVATVANGLVEIGEIETLASTVSKHANLPRGFGLWSSKMQIGWLRQNQVK